MKELSRTLQEAGVPKSLYSVGEEGYVMDAICLRREGYGWRVFYTEPGRKPDDIGRFAQEEDACACVYNEVMKTMRARVKSTFVREDEW